MRFCQFLTQPSWTTVGYKRRDGITAQLLAGSSCYLISILRRNVTFSIIDISRIVLWSTYIGWERAKRMICQRISIITVIMTKNRMSTYSYYIEGQWRAFSSAPISNYVSWASLFLDQPQKQRNTGKSLRVSPKEWIVAYNGLWLFTVHEMIVAEMNCGCTAICTDLTTFTSSSLRVTLLHVLQSTEGSRWE